MGQVWNFKSWGTKYDKYRLLCKVLGTSVYVFQTYMNQIV